ncbi:patatin-like phospholipase family protein [Atopobium fossor]|uniref:patatin-like phospholipase family protein n=1 Tax=Atopobium fossor TaxID=39487 RepID=UPI000422997B|nr:patatin family protein [Atopobium fossor]
MTNVLEPNNITSTALVIEGGGMRGAYTSGLLSVLLEEHIYFSYVCGLSAGASCAVNYVARDLERMRRGFVDVADDPRAGGPKSLLTGRGYFDSEYLYNAANLQATIPLDWETFKANPAILRIQSFERDTGRTVVWGRKHMQTLQDTLDVVRASSTMPGLMNPLEIDGQVMYDGGLGVGAGIPLHIAQDDGQTRFFVVASRPEGYVKPAMQGMQHSAVGHMFGNYPFLRDAILTRAQRYNAAMEHLAKLEQEGRAFVVRPLNMRISNTTLNREELAEAFELGREQGVMQLDAWKEFLL